MPTLTTGPVVLCDNNYSMPNSIVLDFLFPNGLIISLEFARETTLNEVRLKLWSEAKSVTFLFSKLKPIENYIFASVNQEAKMVEYYDNTKRLCDLKMFYTFFKIIEIQGNLQEKTFNSELSKAIGLHINEIEHVKDNEIIEFRLELFKELKATMEEKAQRIQENSSPGSQDEIKSFLQCVYSQNLEIDPSLLDVSLINTVNRLKNIKFDISKNKNNKLDINVHVMETDQPEVTYHLNVELDSTPTDIVVDIIKAKLSALKQSDSQIIDIVNKYKDSYMLNVCGCDEIFYGEKNKISTYKVNNKFKLVIIK